MSATEEDVRALADTLATTFQALGTSFGTLGAVVLSTRALISMLDERGLLSALEVRDRALELADEAGLTGTDIAAAVDLMLPDAGAVAPGVVN